MKTQSKRVLEIVVQAGRTQVGPDQSGDCVRAALTVTPSVTRKHIRQSSKPFSHLFSCFVFFCCGSSKKLGRKLPTVGCDLNNRTQSTRMQWESRAAGAHSTNARSIRWQTFESLRFELTSVRLEILSKRKECHSHCARSEQPKTDEFGSRVLVECGWRFRSALRRRCT